MATTTALATEVAAGGGRAGSRAPRAARRLPRRLRGRRAPQGLAAGHHPRRADRPRLAPRAARRRGRPAGRARHDLAHLLDDQADHLGRGDDALRGGRALALRPGGEVHPVVRRPARVPPRDGGRARHGPGRRADARVAPAHPHLRADLRLPAGQRGRRGVPRGGLLPRPAARRTTSPPPATCGPGCRCSSSPAPSGTTRCPPTCWAGSSRSSPASRWTSSSPSASSSRWA